MKTLAIISVIFSALSFILNFLQWKVNATLLNELKKEQQKNTEELLA